VCYRATAREADTFPAESAKAFYRYIILHLYETVGRLRSHLTVEIYVHAPRVMYTYDVYSSIAYATVIIAKQRVGNAGF